MLPGLLVLQSLQALRVVSTLANLRSAMLGGKGLLHHHATHLTEGRMPPFSPREVLAFDLAVSA
jgi:hypothetical protein